MFSIYRFNWNTFGAASVVSTSVNRWQPSTYMCPISIPAYLQRLIILSSRLLSIISWGIPEVSTSFFLLSCSTFAWFFSHSTFFTTKDWLLRFSFYSISFVRLFEKRDTWSQRILMLLSTRIFPFNISILLTRTFFSKTITKTTTLTTKKKTKKKQTRFHSANACGKQFSSNTGFIKP